MDARNTRMGIHRRRPTSVLRALARWDWLAQRYSWGAVGDRPFGGYRRSELAAKDLSEVVAKYRPWRSGFLKLPRSSWTRPSSGTQHRHSAWAMRSWLRLHGA